LGVVLWGSTLLGNSIIVKATTSAAASEKERVSVHDPSVVKDGDMYYIFGSHIEAAKSSDLQNWSKFTNSYNTPDNVLYGDLSANLAGSFAWAGENDADSTGGFSVWAPDVFYNQDYVNSDGTIGAYMIYYCTSSTYKRSCIGYAVSQNIEGPYTYVDTIVYSGFTKGDSYDAKSTINTNYKNTNVSALIDSGTLQEINDDWFNENGSYNTDYAPNAIDPAIFYDEDETLWMSYGSWSGGIYLLKLDKETGQVIYPGEDGASEDGNLIDRYFGTRIAGGHTKSGEGPYVVYDKDNDYYYLFMSYASLQADGGYNIRLFRSKNPDGPYVDAAGNKATLPSAVDNSPYGIKLMGNYQFDCMEVGYKSCGHNSAFINKDGQMYLVYHTRFNDGTEGHGVRIHQMFMNAEGWPVVAPYEYSQSKISEKGYNQDDVVGYYQFINHQSLNSSTMLKTQNIELKADGTVSGDVTGTWSMGDGTYDMQFNYDGNTYEGVFFKQLDESKEGQEVMTFTAIGDNNQSIWGSRLALTPKEMAEYAAKALRQELPANTKEDLIIPNQGACGTTINWRSNNEGVLSSSGVVHRQPEDTAVTLTAFIFKGDVTITKSYVVIVKEKLTSLNVTPSYSYDFENVDGTNVLNLGSDEGVATLEGKACVVKDINRGQVLSISNNEGAMKENYLKLPEETFSNITQDGYTISMWVNVNMDDPNYWQHSALFEANDNGSYPITRISANLYGRINANGTYADATIISQGLTSNQWEYVTFTVSPTGIIVYLNGEVVSTADKDISACFSNYFLANMTNVSVGSGEVWGDQDISAAKFDNVSVFPKALTETEVEVLYNQEVK
jgi:arabinan endo-1,5-alpha-L-arabinosidase